MKQQIKCPHCNKVFPIEESLKHETEEIRKKLQKEEQQKSQERQKKLDEENKQKLQKQKIAFDKELEKIKTDAAKKQKAEADKQAAAERGGNDLLTRGPPCRFSHLSTDSDVRMCRQTRRHAHRILTPWNRGRIIEVVSGCPPWDEASCPA